MAHICVCEITNCGLFSGSNVDFLCLNSRMWTVLIPIPKCRVFVCIIPKCGPPLWDFLDIILRNICGPFCMTIKKCGPTLHFLCKLPIYGSYLCVVKLHNVSLCTVCKIPNVWISVQTKFQDFGMRKKVHIFNL